jgi:hypothetical protein
VVRLGRLERPTSCFGGTRSIQLSYSRAHHLYHARPVVCSVVRSFGFVVFRGQRAPPGSRVLASIQAQTC